jgi:hypothetical protein
MNRCRFSGPAGISFQHATPSSYAFGCVIAAVLSILCSVVLRSDLICSSDLAVAESKTCTTTMMSVRDNALLKEGAVSILAATWQNPTVKVRKHLLATVLLLSGYEHEGAGKTKPFLAVENNNFHIPCELFSLIWLHVVHYITICLNKCIGSVLGNKRSAAAWRSHSANR